MAKKILQPGTCQLCGCTETTPCATSQGPCSWVDADRTLCSGCVEVVVEFLANCPDLDKFVGGEDGE